MNYKSLSLVALLLPFSVCGVSNSDTRIKELSEVRNHVTVHLAATSALLLANILQELGFSEDRSILSLTS